MSPTMLRSKDLRKPESRVVLLKKMRQGRTGNVNENMTKEIKHKENKLHMFDSKQDNLKWKPFIICLVNNDSLNYMVYKDLIR